MLNEGLKILFQVPRPYVRDPSLTPVAAALDGASGYSFPSGHTATATLTYGSAAAFIRKKWAWVCAAILIAVTMFTRLYLGVHTPADVLVSLMVASVVVAIFFLLFSIMDKKGIDETRLFFGMLVLAAAATIFVSVYQVGAEIMADTRADAFKMLGASLGVFVSFMLDRKYISFDTKALWWQQLIKLVSGLVILILLQTGMKALFSALSVNLCAANCLRYFILMFFAGTLWPLTFTLYTRTQPKVIDK